MCRLVRSAIGSPVEKGDVRSARFRLIIYRQMSRPGCPGNRCCTFSILLGAPMESLGDVRTPYASTAYVFGPKVGLLVLQAFHESDASGIVQEYELGSAVTHPFLGSEKGLVLADDHTRDAEEDRCTGTHRTRAQGRNESE